jgi:hypothetical protein
MRPERKVKRRCTASGAARRYVDQLVRTPRISQHSELGAVRGVLVLVDV